MAVLCILLSWSHLLADSPLTSTVFYEEYAGFPEIQKARELGLINEELIDFLMNPEMGNGSKVALINALGWSTEGKANTTPFVTRLRQKYGLQEGRLYLDGLTASELLCLGYLMAMDDYFNPSQAIPILEMARDKAPKSRAVHTVLALVLSQVLLDQKDWCGIWLTCSEVFANEDLEEDFKPEATSKIRAYVELYRESC
ncbi:MAG: hypothetical protein ACFB10_03135 [Salibacteraceae bacterium]